MPRIQDTRELGAAPTLASLGTVRERIPVPVVLAVPYLAVRAIARQTVQRHPVPWAVVLLAALVAWGGWHPLYTVGLILLAALALVGVLAGASAAGASPLPWLRASVTTMSRRKRIRRTWKAWCLLHGLTSAYDGKPMRRQRRATRTPTGLALDTYPGEAGRAAADVQRQAYRLAALASVERRVLPALATYWLGPGRVRDVQVRHLSPSVARIYIGWTDLLARPLGPADLPPPTLGHVTFGITSDGTAASVPYGRSILLGGESGSGKSTTLHTYVMDILRQRIPTRFRVADPKGGVELAEYDPDRGGMAYRYVEDPRRVAAEFGHFRKGMERRLASMRRRGVTQHLPTEDEPGDVFVIDELLLVAMATDKDTGFADDVIRVLAAGRAACFWIVALSQLGHAEALPIWRNMFPVRICMGTRTWQLTDTILGSGATTAGAKCHLISTAEQGQGYYFSEDTRGFARFKCAHQTDPDKKRIGAGLLPVGVAYSDALPASKPDRRTQPGPIPWDGPDEEGDDGGDDS